MQPDPLIGQPDLSQNYNRYSYVLNSPLSASDPTGLDCGASTDSCSFWRLVYLAEGETWQGWGIDVNGRPGCTDARDGVCGRVNLETGTETYCNQYGGCASRDLEGNFLGTHWEIMP